MKILFTHFSFRTILFSALTSLFVVFTGYNSFAQSQSTFTTSGSWICPAGVTSVTAECWGAGGNGAKATSNGSYVGGGGGGAYSFGVVTVIPGTTYNIVVGNGGTGNSTANSGGDSYFNLTTTVMAKGGNGLASTITIGAIGGLASASVGTIKRDGGTGGTASGTNAGGGGSGAGSTTAANNGAAPAGGPAVASNGGAGGDGRKNSQGQGVGSNGLIYGGGGGGAYRSANSQNGGSGANGYVVISYTCPTTTTAAAGTDQVLTCATTTTLAGNTPTVGTGLWSLVSGTATITTPSSPTSGITGLVIGASATLRWTISNESCGSNFDDVIITSNMGAGCLSYCTPNALTCSWSSSGTTYYSLITNVTLGTINNSTSNNTCPGGTFQDFTASPSATQTTNLTIGSTNTINVTVTRTPSNSSNAVGVWIDYNQNGTFNDPGEYFEIATAIVTNGTATNNLIIPTTALTGTTRMRIRYSDTYLLSAHSCNTSPTSGKGETEDYLVNLICGASPTEVTGRFPTNGLALPCGATATLSWNNHTCATSYDVYLDTSPSPTTLVANTSSTNYYTGNLASNVTYYWKIVPKNGATNGASSTWSFTTQTSISIAISPDTSGCTDGGLCLAATNGTFPDYYWYTVPVNGVPVAAGPTYCPTGLTAPTTFYVANVLLGASSVIQAGTSGTVTCYPRTGAMFNIKAKTANLTITGLTLRFADNGITPTGSTSIRNVKVYYRTNSWANSPGSSSGWILLDNLSISVVNQPTADTYVDITDFFVPSGQTYGVYVVYDWEASAGASIFANTDLEISTGSIFCASEFYNGGNPDFTFRGSVNYKISCSSPTVPVLATPWVSSAQVKIALSTVINAKEQCTESGWTYYANPATKNDWLFAIKKNGNSFTADVDIVESPSVYSNINVPSKHGSFLISRYWNVRVTSGSVVTPVDVRYFFDTAEVRAAYNMRNLERTTNYPTSFDVPWRWFKSIGSDFNPAVGINGNNFTFTNFTPTSVNNLSLLGATYTGYINNVPYVEFTGVPSFSGGTGGYGFTTFAGGSLPVKLVDFNATLENNIVKLTWTTETEINNDYFTIERSRDGVNFETVEVVESKNGNSNITLNYTLNDNYPYKGVSYYRLKQTDNDGKSEYFKTVSVNVNSAFENVAVYPNPVTGNGYLSFKSSSEKDQTITIYDVAGRLVFSKKYIIEIGDNKITLETINLTKGMYFIRMDDSIDGINIKFIKE